MEEPIRILVRWSLTGSFTNSNLTDRGFQSGFGLADRLREVVTQGRFHFTLKLEESIYLNLHGQKTLALEYCSGNLDVTVGPYSFDTDAFDKSTTRG